MNLLSWLLRGARLRTLALAATLPLVAGVLLPPPAAADVNRIVLQVNDHIATLHDYQRRYGERLRALQRSPLSEAEKSAELAGLGEMVFREMFDELLLLSKASRDDVEVTEEMVDDAVTRMRESNGLTDDRDFDQALESTGTTRSMIRDQARRNILLQRTTARELQSRIELDEEDLRRYYQSRREEFAVPRRHQVRSVIVLDDASVSADEQAALASEVATLMAGDQDLFESRVAEWSDTGRTTSIIDLGWVEEGDLDPQIEPQVLALAAGEVGAPIPARGGLHVSQVLAIEEEHTRPFSEVRDEVENLELLRLQQEAVTTMLSDLENSSFIRIDPPPEAAGFRATRSTTEDPLSGLGPADGSGPDEAPATESTEEASSEGR